MHSLIKREKIRHSNKICLFDEYYVHVEIFKILKTFLIILEKRTIYRWMNKPYIFYSFRLNKADKRLRRRNLNDKYRKESIVYTNKLKGTDGVIL